MKKIIILGMFLIILLTSCKKNIDITYKLEEYSSIYVLNKYNNVEKIEIPYQITNITDVIKLYTSYQNYIPINYYSPAHPNLKILNYNIKNNIINLYVNEFILKSDINNLYNILKLSLNELGYSEIHIFYNNDRLI